jgi:transposase
MTNAQMKGSTAKLYMAIEVSEKTWRLAMTDMKSERQVTVESWNEEELARAIAKCKERFGLAVEAPVVSCYEAGRVGFSLHRLLVSLGIENVVVDPASIEVARGRRHRKTDRLDAAKLMTMLVRYRVYGEKKTWHVCRVPDEAIEAARRLDREYEQLKTERTRHTNRIRSLLAVHGIAHKNVRELEVGRIRDWSGALLADRWQQEMGRELARLDLVDTQLKELEAERKASFETPQTEADEKVVRLEGYLAVGPVSATALAREFFWRKFDNVRQVGAAAGLTGCPYDSGNSHVEQGISKAGNCRIRTLMIELAWGWLRWQKDSALSQWYERRFGGGTRRQRRIGIVALARKLLVALWKFLEHGILIESATYYCPEVLKPAA